MKWNPETFFYHYLMPKGQQSVILGSDRKMADDREGDEKISSDPYLFPHHVLIERLEDNQFKIMLLHNLAIVVIHQKNEIKTLTRKGDWCFLDHFNRVVLTDKVQFIFDPQ
jgi:hypothetical protein